jgi:hypothetical protein
VSRMLIGEGTMRNAFHQAIPPLCGYPHRL